MARSRNIKPGFFANEVLAECEPLARLLFAGLWCLADRAGRLEDRPKRIRAEVLPYDAVDADELLNQLQRHGFIVRYECDGGRYIQVLNFEKHQNPHIKEAKSTIPAHAFSGQEPDEHSTSMVQVPGEHEKSPADSLSLDSGFLIPDPLPTREGRDADGSAPMQVDQRAAGQQVQPKAKPELTEGFESFWKAYPRKVAKADAAKVWKKLKPDEALITTIMESLGKYCLSHEWVKDGGQFVPHPATWLNGRRWEDEVRPASNAQPIQPSRFVNLPAVNGNEIRDKTAENERLGVRRANF